MMCKMARVLGSEDVYLRYRDVLDRGSAAFDKLLWNGKGVSACTYLLLLI